MRACGTAHTIGQIVHFVQVYVCMCVTFMYACADVCVVTAPPPLIEQPLNNSEFVGGPFEFDAVSSSKRKRTDDPVLGMHSGGLLTESITGQSSPGRHRNRSARKLLLTKTPATKKLFTKHCLGSPNLCPV